MKKVDEKWIILAMCCLTVCASVGISNGKSVFLVPICEGLSITRGAYGWATTICAACSSLLMLAVPKIFRKYGIKPMITVGCIIQALSYLLLSFSQNIVMLYIAYAITGIGYCMFGTGVLLIVINQWFVTGNGLASSILASFTGISGALMSPLFSSIIEKNSWRTGAVAMAVLSVALCLPIILYRRNLFPAQIQTADGQSTAPEEQRREVPFKTKIFLCLTYGLCSLGVSIAQYISGVGATKGMTSAECALMVSVVMIGNVCTKLSFGPLADRFGAAKVSIFMFTVDIVASLGMIFFSDKKILFVSAFLLGSIYSVVGLGVSLLVKQVLGNDGYIDWYPKMSLCYTAIYSLSGPSVGYIFDLTGSYTLAFILLIVLDLVNMLIAALLMKSSVSENVSG